MKLRASAALVLLCAGCTWLPPPALSPAPAGSCRAPSVTWYSPLQPDQRDRLDRWCAAVGYPVVREVPAPGVGPEDEPDALDDIVVVSWNVHVGNGDLRRLVADLRAGRLTDGHDARHFVLLLQEAVRTEGVPPLDTVDQRAAGAPRIGRGHPASDIVGLSRDLGLSLVYVPSMRNGGRGDPPADRGSAILATFPLSHATAVELPGERQRRVAIFARGRPGTFGVVHLDALGARARLRALWTPGIRKKQMQALEPFLLTDAPLVVGADLNTWHGTDEPVARYLRRMFAGTPVEVERQGLGLRVLDYLFFRGLAGQRGRYRELADTYGSDHRPLVGWIGS
jgi:endonuclease/exonuclease/phosphatase family metal-dependent hydrolase